MNGLEEGQILQFIGHGKSGTDIPRDEDNPIYFATDSHSWARGSKESKTRSRKSDYFKVIKSLWTSIDDGLPLTNHPGILYVDRHRCPTGTGAVGLANRASRFWMELPELPSILPGPIQISPEYSAEFDDEGGVKVGCQELDFETIEQIYNAARSVREGGE